MSPGALLNFQLNLTCIFRDTFDHLYSLVGVFIYFCYAIILAVCAVAPLCWKHNFWLSSMLGIKISSINEWPRWCFLVDHFKGIVADNTFNHNNAPNCSFCRMQSMLMKFSEILSTPTLCRFVCWRTCLNENTPYHSLSNWSQSCFFIPG